MSILKNRFIYSVLLVGILAVMSVFFVSKIAHASTAATITSSKVIGPNTVQIIFSNPVDWVIGDFTSLNIGGAKTVLSAAEVAPSASVTITWATGAAVGPDATGTVTIAALVDGGSGYTFAGQVGQGLGDGQVPGIASIALTNPTTITVTYTESVKSTGASNANNWVLSAGAGSPTISSVQDISAGSTTQTLTIAGYTGGQMQLLYTNAGSADITDSSSNLNPLATTTAANVVDSTVPTIVSKILTSPTAITVTYSEQVTTAASTGYANWTLTSTVGTPSISATTDINATPSTTQVFTISGYTGGQMQLAYDSAAAGGTPVLDTSAASNPLATAGAADVTDATAPTIASIALTNTTTITVTYSEQVNTPGASNADNWVLSAGAGTPTIVSVQNIAAGSNTQTITITGYTGGQMQLLYTDAGSQDIHDTSTAVNAMVTTTAANVVDSTVPTITSIALTNPTTITVTYSEQVKTAATTGYANWTLTSTVGTPSITASTDINATPATTQVFTITGYTGGQMQLAYSSVGGTPTIDSSTAANPLATAVAANVVDSTVPTISSIALTSPTTITVTYSEQVTTPATSSATNWTLSGGTGSPTISSVSNINATPSTTQTITIAGYTGGQLQLAYTTVGGSAATDTSAALNALAIAVAADVVDTTVPTFTASRTAVNTIVLTFSETVTGTAISGSFTVVGQTAATTNSSVTGGTAVTLTTTGLTATSGTVNVTYVPAVGNILDGATTPNEVGSGAVAASDHVKPAVVSAKITGPNAITVVYSELVTSTAADYTSLVLVAGGARTVSSVSGSGTATIVLTFSGAAAATDDTATMAIGATVLDTSAATNALIAVPAQAVTDAQKPTFTADRTALNTIVLTFSEPITGTAIANSFTVVGASAVTNTAVTSDTTVTLTTTGLTATNGTPAVGYVAATGDMLDDSAALNEVADGGAIAATDHVKPTFTADRTALNTIVLTFSENVDVVDTSGNGYAVAGATVVSSTDPAGTSNTITLTTSGLADYNGAPAVTYTQATGSTVDASAQANEVANGFSVTATDLVSPFAIGASLAQGAYHTTQYVALSSVGASSIRYTIDGTTPSCTVGTVYTGSITITATKTINAIACDSATPVNSSGVSTFTYTITASGTGGGSLGGGSGSGSTGSTTTTTTTTTITTPVATPNTGAGCGTGDKFSATTGMACPTITTTTVGCSAGDKFSATTGQACATNAIGTVVTPAPQSGSSKGTFTRTLTIGSSGNDVKSLQQFLNAQGFTVSTSGAGAKGSESTTFGSKTKAALAKFQAANKITPSVGYFGAITRAFIESMSN